MNHNKPKEPTIKVLFLRSNLQIGFNAFIAGGLKRSDKIDFFQFPPLPEESKNMLLKHDQPEEKWEDLQINLIESCHQYKEKLTQGEFDLILLLDTEADLFRYLNMSWWSKSRIVLGLFKRVFSDKTSDLKKKLIYFKGQIFSPKELNRISPLVVIDFNDWICLTPSCQKLLQDSTYYFKREIPHNRYHLFYQKRPAPWSQKRSTLLKDIEKVQGIPLGLEDSKYYRLKKERVKKQDIDILYAGLATSTLRIKAVECLKRLQQRSNLNIVIEESIPFAKYCELVARSKVTVSIEGGGWDCIRHYEAIALGSTPFMNRPWVDAVWWKDLPSGLFFDNEFSDFEGGLFSLLKNSADRKGYQMILTKRVESSMLHSKIVEYIVYASLENMFAHCGPKI